MHTRIHTIRQISQAMGYLHAKGIVMGKLNSKNIYLEPKVKLCLMDYGMPEKPHDRLVNGTLYVNPTNKMTFKCGPISRELVGINRLTFIMI